MHGNQSKSEIDRVKIELHELKKLSEAIGFVPDKRKMIRLLRLANYLEAPNFMYVITPFPLVS